MRLELTGRHVDITPALRRLVDEQARQARTAAERQRRLGAGRAHAREAPACRAEITLHARGEQFLHGVGDGRDAGRPSLTRRDRQDRAAGAEAEGQVAGAEAPRTPARPLATGRAASAVAVAVQPAPRVRDARMPRVMRADAPADQADVGRRRRARGRRRRRRRRRLPQRGDGSDQRPVPPRERRAHAGRDRSVRA